MNSDDLPTCGKGLAAQAVFPARLADLMAALADVLERHVKALEPTDPNGRAELDAYTTLAHAHRGIATELARLAQRMAGYRDLPMARHDMAVLADPKGQAEAFQRFVALEREILALLQAKLEEAEELSR